ncbi:MAG: autotransporter domain-containing protein, partial [Pseudomonadota bacterium]
FAQGIDADGAEAEISNGGAIDTAGFDAEGIDADGDNAAITNTGTISTAGASAEGILSAGENATITNTGAIATVGAFSDGLNAEGDAASISHGGTIDTVGFAADGITSSGDDAVITVDEGAEITTGDGFADGIESEGVNASIANDGLIQTLGDDANGILSEGDDAAIVNTGSIATAGEGAVGILSEGDRGVITNAGDELILTTGEGADGIRTTGDGTAVTNDGAVVVLGAGSSAVFLDADDGTLVNNGLLEATGEDSFALQGGDGDQTVTLKNGSRIVGAIDLGGGIDTVNIEIQGPVASQLLTLGGTEVVNANGEINVLVAPQGDDALVQIVDLTAPSVFNEANAAVTGSAHRAILGRDRARGAAASESSAEDAGKAAAGAASTAWISGFGARRERGNDGATLAFDHEYAGLITGYERDLGGVTVGVTGGFAFGTIETDITSQEADVQTFFGGVYLALPTGLFDITGSVLAGIERYDNERFVTDNLAGSVTAQSDVDNTFVSASLTAETEIELGGGVTLRPSASASYNASFFGDAAESGAGAANLDFDSRTAHTFGTRAQLAAGYDAGLVDLEVRAGVDSRFSTEDDITGSFADQIFSLEASDSGSNVAGFIGGRVTLTEFDRVRVSGDLEYRLGQNQERGIAAGLTLSVDF